MIPRISPAGGRKEDGGGAKAAAHGSDHTTQTQRRNVEGVTGGTGVHAGFHAARGYGSTPVLVPWVGCRGRLGAQSGSGRASWGRSPVRSTAREQWGAQGLLPVPFAHPEGFP